MKLKVFCSNYTNTTVQTIGGRKCWSSSHLYQCNRTPATSIMSRVIWPVLSCQYYVLQLWYNLEYCQIIWSQNNLALNSLKKSLMFLNWILFMIHEIQYNCSLLAWCIHCNYYVKLCMLNFVLLLADPA